MKNRALDILLILFSVSLNAQLSGTIYDSNKLSLPGTEIKFREQKATTDIDGNFILEQKGSEKGNLFLGNNFISGVSTEIKNFPIENFHNLKVYLLSLKQITSEELKIGNIDNSNILDDVCLCYSYRNNHYYRDRLDGNSLAIILDGRKYEITKFEFDIKNQNIIVDWNEVNK